MRIVPIVLWHLILLQNEQNFCYCLAFSTQVSGVGMALLGYGTSPNLLLPTQAILESQEVYSSVLRPEGIRDDIAMSEHLASNTLAQWSNTQ